MREYHPPDSGGAHASSNRGPDPMTPYPQHPPDHYSGNDPPDTHSSRTAQSDHRSARHCAAYDSGHHHYRNMDYPPSSRRDVVPPSRASAESYPPSEAGSTMPLPGSISSPPSEIDLSTSRKPLHSVIAQTVPTPAESTNLEGNHGRRINSNDRSESLGFDAIFTSHRSASAGEDEATSPVPQPGNLCSVPEPVMQGAAHHPASTNDISAPSMTSGPAVSTWMRRHEPGSHLRGSRFSTEAYDANSVAVPRPRLWGRGIGEGQQQHQLSQVDRRQSSISTQSAPAQSSEDSSANVRRDEAPSSVRHTPEYSPQPYAENGHSAFQTHGFDHHSSIHSPGSARDGSVSGQGSAHPRDQSRHVSPTHQTQILPSVPSEADEAVSASHCPQQPIDPEEDYGPRSDNLNLAPATQLRPSARDEVETQVLRQEPAAHSSNYAALLSQGERAPPRYDGDQTYGHRPPQSMAGQPLIPEGHATQWSIHRAPSDDRLGTRRRDSLPSRDVSHPPAKTNFAEPTAIAVGHESIDQGWAPKPTAEERSDTTPWNSPNIHAWAHDVNNNQPDSGAPALHAGVDGSSLPDRPDSARHVPQPVHLHNAPDGIFQNSPQSSAINYHMTAYGEGAESTVLLANKSTSIVTDPNESDEFDRPETPTDIMEGASQLKHARAEIGRPFWWEEPHPRDCPKFQSRRIIVTTPFPIRTDEFRGFLLQHFKRYGPVRCISPFALSTPDQSDRAAVVFHFEDSMVQLYNDPKRHEASFRSTATTSRPVPIRLNIYQRPADAEFLGFWIMITGPRHDDGSRSPSPTTPDRCGALDNIDKRTVPASLEVWAVPSSSRGGRLIWAIRLWDPLNGKFKHDMHGAQGEPTLLETIDLSRRTLDKEFLPRLVSYYCEIQDIVIPQSPSEPWKFVVCRSWKLSHLFSQLRCLPGFSVDRWNMNAKWRGNSPEPTLTPEDSDHGGTDLEEILRGGPKLELAAHERSVESPNNLKRRVIPTYRGRHLRKTLQGGQPRFIDDAAVYVTNLARQETARSLTERFSKYGEIFDVEMEPGRRCGRVMFNDKKAAFDAIQFEDGQLSLGSVIHVLDRAVPPQYVDKTHVLVDDQGRTVDPSAVRCQVSSEQMITEAQPQNNQPGDAEQGRTKQSHTFNVPIPVSSTPRLNLRQLFIVEVGYSTGAPKATVHQMLNAGVTADTSRTDRVSLPIDSRGRTEDTQVAPSNVRSTSCKAVLNPPVKRLSPKSPPIDPNEPKPRVLSTSYDEAGLFRPTYDPEELKMWKDKNSISQTPGPKSEDPKAETPSIQLVSTGDHESIQGSISVQMPHSAAPSSNLGNQHGDQPPLDQHGKLPESSSKPEVPSQAAPDLYSHGRVDIEAQLRLSHPQPVPQRLNDRRNVSTERDAATPVASRSVDHGLLQQSIRLESHQSDVRHVQCLQSDRPRQQSYVCDHNQDTYRGKHHQTKPGQRSESRYEDYDEPTRRTEVSNQSDPGRHRYHHQARPARRVERERHMEARLRTEAAARQRDHSQHDSRQGRALPQAENLRCDDRPRQSSLSSDRYTAPRQSRDQRQDHLCADVSRLDETSQRTERYNASRMAPESRPQPEPPRQWREDSQPAGEGSMHQVDRWGGSSRGSRPATDSRHTQELELREEQAPSRERYQQPAANHHELAEPCQPKQARDSAREPHQPRIGGEECQGHAARNPLAPAHEHASSAQEEEDTGGW